VSERKTFVRDATGLVKSLSFLDQFIVSQAIIVLVNGFVLTALFAPLFFPGANLALVFVIGSIPAFAMAYVYSKFAAGMPRSGGDYIWSTRILGPIFGSVQLVFLLVTTLIVGITLSTYSETTIALSGMVYSLGVTTNNPGLVTVAKSLATPGINLGFAVAMILIVIFAIVSLLGLRVYAWFQRASLLIYYISTAAFIVVLIAIPLGAIKSDFNAAMSMGGSTATYDGIVAAPGAPPPGAFSLTSTLLAAIPWGFLTFTGFNYGAYLSGETRNVKSSMFRALFLSVIVTIVLLVILAELVYRDFGSSFLNAASYVQSCQANLGGCGLSSPAYYLPTYPSTSFLASITSTPAAIAVGLSLFVGWIVVCVAYIVTYSRTVFAAAFDRLLPAKFADVSDRFHSPQWAVLLVSIVSGIFVAFYYTANSFAGTYLITGMVGPIGYLLPLVATMLFPIVKPDLFKKTVGQFASAGAIVATSLVGVASFAFYIFALNVPLQSLAGVAIPSGSLVYAYVLVFVIIVIGLAIYGTARARMGDALANVYREIPPE
jgi:APA family basic amino acid/polyamine antiporter